MMGHHLLGKHHVVLIYKLLGGLPAAGTSYEIKVQVTYDGVVWDFGSGCMITTPLL